MSLRALVANSGLTDDVCHAIFQAEMRSYRNELVHLDAMWKMRPEWATVGDRDADLRVFEGVWSGIFEDGLGAPRGAEFVAKHFGERSDEEKTRIRSLLRANADLSEAFRRDAEQRLAQFGIAVDAVSLPVAVDLMARARAEAAKLVRTRAEMVVCSDVEPRNVGVSPSKTVPAPMTREELMKPPEPKDPTPIVAAPAPSPQTDEQKASQR